MLHARYSKLNAKATCEDSGRWTDRSFDVVAPPVCVRLDLSSRHTWAARVYMVRYYREEMNVSDFVKERRRKGYRRVKGGSAKCSAFKMLCTTWLYGDSRIILNVESCVRVV